MNLPDAIERLRMMHEEALDRISKWDAIERAHPLRTNRVMTEAFTIDAEALAVCLEALAELQLAGVLVIAPDGVEHCNVCTWLDEATDEQVEALK